MDAQGQDMTPQLLQRLLPRLDFIEYRLVRDNQSDTVEQVERLRTDRSKFREAARLEAADRALADAWAVAPRFAHVGHMGPRRRAHAFPACARAVAGSSNSSARTRDSKCHCRPCKGRAALQAQRP